MKVLIKQMLRSLLSSLLAVAVILIFANRSFCQETKQVPNGTDGLMLNVPPADSSVKKMPPNEFVGSKATFKIGVGYIHDAVTYIKSDEFNKQLDSAKLSMDPMIKVRDFRVLASGAFRTKRPFSFKFAFMYDGDKETWMVRESGVTVGLPELHSSVFVGRTKEGYSLVKVMNGHSPWTAERQMALDVVPILADGIKLFGSLPKSRVFWNLGYYNDVVSEGQGFSTFKWQGVARVGWLPYYDKARDRVLHIAANFRFGDPLNGTMTLKSRPESNPSPFLINTGAFAADHSTSTGGEIYYSTGRLLLGSEFMTHKFTADGFDSHSFSGGDLVATYMLTKTKRPYNTTASIFGFVKVNSSVFKGGWGEWEAVLRYSTLDLDDKSIKGGKFWRITPMINWYMTRNLRSEFVYGYGIWDRYNLKGAVQFFQYRIQLTVL
jgi:phosphate-selective porin OprO/OprP